MEIIGNNVKKSFHLMEDGAINLVVLLRFMGIMPSSERTPKVCFLHQIAEQLIYSSIKMVHGLNLINSCRMNADRGDLGMRFQFLKTILLSVHIGRIPVRHM